VHELANIGAYLEKIKIAVFGKDVRGSIIDGIKAINQEVETTTSFANETQQRQDELSVKHEELSARQDKVHERIDNLVIQGDSSLEAAEAREDVDGVKHRTLKARLDSDSNKQVRLDANGKVPIAQLPSRQISDVTGLPEEIDKISILEANAVTTHERDKWNGVFSTNRLHEFKDEGFEVIEKTRLDGTLAAKSVFSDMNAKEKWLVRTYNEYAEDGITVTQTVTFDLIYNEKGIWIKEVIRK
jgi:hypothetical protein